MPLRFIDKDRQGVGLGEFVGGVDNKAGHYSVSPGRQGWADGPREEATHVAVLVGGGADPGTRVDPRQRMPGLCRCTSSQWPVGARDGYTSSGHQLDRGFSLGGAPSAKVSLFNVITFD